MILVKNLQVFRARKQILKINQLKVVAGEKISLFGPNGSGKSTLLRSLALIEPESLRAVFYNSRDANWQIGYLMQEPYFFRGTVEENLVLPLKLRKIPEKIIKKKLGEFTEKYKLESLLRKNPKVLSGGEKQRINLLRTLIYEPFYLFLDEPFTGIDALTKKELNKYLQSYLEQEPGRILIYVSHDLKELLKWGKRFWYLKDGEIKFDLAKEEFLKLNYQDDYLQLLFEE
ncbi:ABC transporter ATP-binding protein [Carboxydothermus hydrogenoformans]|uniref:Anion ABC transporter, ATP-binding protein n=1 Tax=Carboxydothermus hydrogenoformans (strain ATCC BAA-161 / DSM 6008 / Z-2901) TaxID=246194 RepID=Q3AF44_CARHZ|nr:energy-coupling factor ABC transporter ATP-binding protein [Carboxydothermus hydrogenoformans]ABB16051.1 anion ABC transporter, ATP-binding protein [Carboxydothermus hydrogenoformans Z-2901]